MDWINLAHDRSKYLAVVKVLVDTNHFIKKQTAPAGK
jgi:hypothetical protein